MANPKRERVLSWRSVAALAAVLCVGSASPVAGDGPAASAERFGVVVIDAGHGGEDEGARGPGNSLEKDVVLQVAIDLRRELAGRGLRVVMTRTRDVFVPLEERTHIANDARGHLFVSIHANASGDRDIRGSETFFLSLDASDDSARHVAERENRAFGAAGVMPEAMDDPLLAVLGDLIANEHLTESQEFARMAQLRMGRIDPNDDRGVKQAPFVVLTGVHMPASLVEIGFITNSVDERRLASAAGRQAVVAALAEAVVEYGRRYDALRGEESLPARSAR